MPANTVTGAKVRFRRQAVADGIRARAYAIGQGAIDLCVARLARGLGVDSNGGIHYVFARLMSCVVLTRDGNRGQTLSGQRIVARSRCHVNALRIIIHRRHVYRQ